MGRRRVTARNLLGGLLGGTSGILAVAFAGASAPLALMPLTTTLGVLLGWFSFEVRDFAADLLLQGQSSARAIVGPRWHASSRWLKGLGLLLVPLTLLLGGIGSIARSVRRRYARLRNSPTRLARGVRFAALAVYSLLVLHAMLYLYPRFGAIDSASPVFSLYFGVAAFTVITLIFPAGAVFVPSNLESPNRMGLFDDYFVAARTRQRFGSTGFLGIMVIDYLRLSMIEVLLLLLMVVSLVLLAIGVFTILLPIVLLSTCAHVVNLSARHRGHWACLVVTLTVTALMARYLGPEMSVAVVWFLALLTGVISALLSEVAFRLCERILSLEYTRENLLDGSPLQIGCDALNWAERRFLKPLNRAFSGLVGQAT